MVCFHSTRLSAGALCAVALAAAVVLPQLVAGQEDGLDVGDDAEFGFFHHDVDETTVAVGGRFVCALEAGDEEVGGIPSCWGRNKHNNCNPPKEVMVQVCASELYACGITVEGSLRCWGARFWGDDKPGSYLQVSCGMHHTCAITKQNTVRCWGNNEAGQLEAPPGEFVQVSSGQDHSCALRADGSLACWGSRLKDALDAPEGQFVQVSVSASRYSCAIRVGGDVVCWGNPSYGITGTPKYDGIPFLQVTTARTFACGLKESGKLVCWGDSSDFKAARGDTHEYIEISSWQHTLCGIDANPPHGIRCWGSDKIESKPDFHTAV